MAQERTNQQGWNSLLKSVELPEDAAPATIPTSAIAGAYMSDLYGTMLLSEAPDSANMTVLLGPDKYQGSLMHVTDNTWYLSWPNPDDIVGYLTFKTGTMNGVTGFTSEEIGPFSRV